MHRNLPGTLIWLATVPALWACGSDCEDTTRLDGDWSVTSRVADARWQISGFDTSSEDASVATEAAIEEAELLAQLVVNGSFLWNLRRDGTSDQYALRIDDQSYEARIVPRKGACNSFDIRFSGMWPGAEGSVHNFSFDGRMTFLGDELTGAWKYSDNFSWDDRGASGAVAIPSGVFTGTRAAADSGP